MALGLLTVLPVDNLIPDILARLRSERSLILEAPPGAGKTTRVPPALLSAVTGEVVVLEPRRLATRLAARRVAFELGERPGETAGYQIRFEEVAGPKTRLRFMTEGVLTRRLLADPLLRGVSVVVLDEFHERHMEGDLALALVHRLQHGARPDLRVLVMSATLESGPLSRFLDGCPVLRSSGRQFELAVGYTPVSALSLEEQVAAALEQLLRQGLEGDVLIFLPGAAEIRRVMRACEGLARRADLLLLPLYGDLSLEEQDRAIGPADRRKIIFSTNVAESSVTIEGIRAVIDSGLARIARQSPWSGLPRVDVMRISQASANQRAGRAGRTAPGRVIRLYPQQDFLRRPAQDTPEVLRAELSPLRLLLAAMRVEDLDWLDAPPQESRDAAAALLRLLGAVDGAGRITAAGRRMAQMPLHPRLGRLVLEAAQRGLAEAGCGLAALLSSGERLGEGSHAAGPSDLLVMLERGVDSRTRQIARQIRSRLDSRDGRLESPRRGDEALLMATLAAFPDRVARRRQGDELLLAGGGSARLAASSVVRQDDFLVAVDIEERSEQGLPLVRLASAVKPEWLLDLFPESVTERATLEWNRTAERVERVSALLFQNLIIEESRQPAPPDEATAKLLAERAFDAGLNRWVEAEELEQFRARVEFASRHSALPPLEESGLRAALETLCLGRRSFAELERADFLGALEAQLPPGGLRTLNELAPARLRLPGGRWAKVRYAAGQTPWVASRLQDFFGMRETPRIAGGQVALVVHLLAPNQRPVQMTTDLAGFWERLYPQVRRELSRRYPRHAWPEKP